MLNMPSITRIDFLKRITRSSDHMALLNLLNKFIGLLESQFNMICIYFLKLALYNIFFSIFSWLMKWDLEKLCKPSPSFAWFPKWTKMLALFWLLLPYPPFSIGNERLNGLPLEYRSSCYTPKKMPLKSGTI